jgi:lipid II:glycine glycyltransferase (peptidoglycan interpeptide bridge formation enzyme)
MEKNINGFDFIIPLVERVIWSNGTQEKDLLSPYGYPGILYPENIPKEIYLEALKLFQSEAAAAAYISSFIRLHPIYNTFQVNGQSNITQHYHGPTVSINLNLPLAVIRKSYSQNHKRNIKSLLSDDYQIEVNNWASLDAFVDLYLQTMQRKHAQKRYFFSHDYFHQLKKSIGHSLILISINDKHGKIASGGLFSLFNGLAQFHLGGTSENFLNQSPSKLMIDAAIEACKEKGAHTLHLGGGYGSANTDGLFRFKAGFGSQLHKFSTLRMIHNPEVYKELVKNTKGINNSANGFFSEYRKPSIKW